MYQQELVDFFEQNIPFNRHLGIRVTSISRGKCTLCAPYSPEWIGDPSRPALHGGLLSTVADAAGGLAVFSQLPNPRNHRASTVDLRIDYLRPGLLEDVYCDAEILRLGQQVAVTEMVCRQGNQYITAKGRGVYNLYRGQP